MVDYSKWAKMPSSPSSSSSSSCDVDTSTPAAATCSPPLQQQRHLHTSISGNSNNSSSNEVSPEGGAIASRSLETTNSNRRRGAVVFLHGTGHTGRGVRDWLNSASGGKFERTLRELRLGPAVFPTAPKIPYTPAGGRQLTVWFDREMLSPGSPQDRQGVLRSLQQVDDEVRKLECEGAPVGGIFVGGFSMGGCLALEALGSEALVGRLAGVFSHASFLSDDSAVFDAARVTSAPVYASHGVADGKVKASWGRKTVERLRGKGFEVSFAEHEGMTHELGDKQIAGLLDWITAVASRPGFGRSSTSLAGESGGSGVRGSSDGTVARGASTSIPLGVDSGAGGGAVAQEPPCSVAYEISDLGGCRCRVLFDVPLGSAELLSGASICARGACFTLETGPTPGRVSTTFMSPLPDLTAAAIARRIEQRLEDPRPPGVDEACCLS